MVDRTGQQLGNYRLRHLLGKGGFAEVYLGEHIHLGTNAAVKVLRAQLSRSDAEEFKREARTLAHLKNDHIVRVLDYGIDSDGETPYLVMDYAPRGTLRKLYQRGVSVPPARIITYVKQVAAALYFAHSQNIVHRDVKPENMLLDDQDKLLLSDFGISIMLQSSKASTQSIAGTATYMAPEQIRGNPRSASDQYSLAVVVYEWLVGRPPFQGSFPEITSQHLMTSPPSLRSMNPAIPLQIENVIMVALNKDPDRRFASIQAFANAFEQMYLASQQIKTPSPGARPPDVVIRRLEPESAPSQFRPVGPSPHPAQHPVPQPAPQSAQPSGPPAFLPALPKASVSDFWWPTFFITLEERKSIGSGMLPQERLGVSGNLYSSDTVLIPLPISDKRSQPTTSSIMNIQGLRQSSQPSASTGQTPVAKPAGPAPAVRRSTRAGGAGPAPKGPQPVPPGQAQRTSGAQAAPVSAAALKRAMGFARTSLATAFLCLLLIGLTFIPPIGRGAIGWGPLFNFILSVMGFCFGIAGFRQSLPPNGKKMAGWGITLSVLVFLLEISWIIYYNSYLLTHFCC